ncbi:uncharacterized protein A1O9_02930 [Exophiala aquamarina CBS 119918]|uniref:CID domain-containing protein n=1 Tax=Exophiala aquamarina CBS 119918 TaxID=1182545 RepID=A0A072PMR7_9EURO|nr:uncharacterized protein A1O9_02930 [Exophiala aquamarina CBS 119918]KEF61364.1 hypothetical protein A1O9_02930 [Exophiala aquamarina CBS 119918]
MAPPTTDLSSKFGATTKKSIFERQKAEAEAKKAREKAETAAVLEDFVKSFDDENDSPQLQTKRTGGGFGSGGSSAFGPGPGKRHFTSSGLKSGPGSLGPSPSAQKSGPGSLGPTPPYGKKRHYDDYSGGRDRGRDRDDDPKGMFSYNDSRERDRQREMGSFAREEDESREAGELEAAAKPTLHLSCLPPGTSSATIKGLFTPSPLNIENVRILANVPTLSSERKSISAIVTLAAETPATDIDTMVSHLQNKYLGFGFNLSLSRHLSSVALTGSNSLGNTAPSSGLNNLPFGARPIPQHTSLSRAPPPGRGPGRFPPPASYTSSTPYGSRGNLPSTQVTVQTPSDLKQLKLIHKTVEALLTYGPEFEALLMSRPQIQRDEQWAWLWDSRSIGGVYYRWRLWEILTNAEARLRRQAVGGYGSQPRGDIIFEGQSTWVPPEETLKFEYTTRIEDFVSDDDYNSSDEEDMDEGGGLARRYHDHQKLAAISADNAVDNDGIGYLNPLGRTKLVHLLSRVPESNSKLRKGDVARVTGFAIEHAGAGADEVAAMITRNVIKPFCFNVKRPKNKQNDSDDDEHRDGLQQKIRDNQGEDLDDPKEDEQQQGKDTTPTSLVGLYLISDILSCSASSGVRHAWRYRSLFETQLRVQNVFPILGRAERTHNWGKLKADKWYRSVQSVLSLWEGWCVFPSAAHDAFVDEFLHPPLTETEKLELEKKERDAKLREETERERNINASSVSRWRTVDEDEAAAQFSSDRTGADIVMRDSGGDAEGDLDGDLDGDPMPLDDNDEYDDDRNFTDADLDGVPMLDSSDEEEGGEGKSPSIPGRAPSPVPGPPPPPPPPPTAPSEQDCTPSKASPDQLQTQQQAQSAAGRRGGRPKAADFDDVDMFE